MRPFLVVIGLALVATLGQPGQGLTDPPGTSREAGTLVPAEEYPVFDRVVESKFMTSTTRAVVIERWTVTRVHPEVADPPNGRWFDTERPFDGRLRPDLIRDFVAKNQRPARLEGRFQLPATVRFVTPEGLAEPEVRLLPFQAPGGRWYAEFAPNGPAQTVDRLAFSRVAFSARRDEALVYVSHERPDGTGAGFLLWLRQVAGKWTIVDTETLWVAHPDGGGPEVRE